MKVNSEIDCNQWYQLIRPVVLGCHARKPSEIRTLDLAGECNAEFWSKIPWHLTEYPRKREFYSFIQSPNDEYLKELGKTELCKDIASVRKPCSAQNAANGEAVDALWDSAESAYPECSEKSNIEAIKAFLNKRRSDLEKRFLRGGENLFGRYGLGSHAGEGGRQDSDDDQLMKKLNNLFKMIDRMAEERMKPVVQGEDVFDKNNPITGKVGFWRDEINGIREFTDLEEALDFGGLENDGDFKKYLVQKNRGRFDSKGNFISASEDDLLPGEDTTSVVDHVDEKLEWKETGTNSYAKYAKSAVTAQADQKPRKYPDWEFPMCNYPRWIHQMYRMDQVKIGQLVKQGYGSPKYCSPWNVCRDQGKNSEVTSRNDLSKNSTFDEGSNQDDKLTASQIGGQKTGKHSRALRQVKGRQGRNTASRGMNNAEGSKGSKITFGLDEFLENFEKEQQELSKLETDSYGQLIQHDEFGDITDLINEYQRKLTEEDDILKEAITRRRAEAKEQMIKRRQEAERKASAALQKKKLQEESQKRQQQREKDSFGAKKESLGRSTRYSGKSSVHFIRTDSSDRREAKRRPPPIVICRRIESWPIDKTKEIECMDRFNVLLRNQQDRAVSQEKFIELAKQIPPLVQSAPPKKLTPCEKLKPLVANGLD